MPAPTHLISITPIASVSIFSEALGITPPSAPVRTESDPMPRPVTHLARSAGLTEAQWEIVNNHRDGPANPALADSILLDWLRSDPSPYNQLLIDNGLTLISTEML